MSIDQTRRALLISGAAALAAPRLGLAPAAAQEAGAAAPGAPPAYVRRIGDMTLTAVLDGYFGLDQTLLVNAPPDETAAALEAAFLDPAASIDIGIVGYLLQGGGRTMVIDAGAAGIFGPTTGRFAAGLAALGVAPGDVDTILVTHMHADHIGGLLDGEAAAFPGAALRVSAADLSFWTDEAIASRAPADFQPAFARARATAAAYGDRVETFEGEAEFAPGIVAVPLPGHTVGQSGFRIASGADQIVVAADAVGLAALQFRNPSVGLVFDTDPAQAAATRAALLDMAAADGLLMTATHLPFPTFGHVVRADDAFAWAPEEWRYR